MAETEPTEADSSEEATEQERSETVEDDAAKDTTVAPVAYQITSYGADYDVEGIVKRTRNKDIEVPPFQRNYVWTFGQACRFIESLLLGLPVPGVFLAREESTGRFLILDGQQRIKTLLFFYEGLFDPPGKVARAFALDEVQPGFKDKTYKTLDERDRRRLDNGIIHATIVKQESPPEDVDTSLFYIFERLNSGETRITHEEARSAVFHGTLINEIKTLNDYENWRKIFGRKNLRLKDQELILRFLALYFTRDKYSRPMAEFLNKFTARNKNPNPEFLQNCRSLFRITIDLVYESVGAKAFRRERSFNAAVFDSVMVGLSEALQMKPSLDKSKVADAYHRLLADKEYTEATSRSTADESFVSLRLEKAIEHFATIS